MMTNIRFRIAAKTDVGLERKNNEDNFQASSDLNHYPMRWVNNEICSLGNKGALLVVADGMGGMNAGEVASEIAIETIKEYFQPNNITDNVTKNRYSIEKFMKSSIEEADTRIKNEAKEHPESKGMGTTIVIGWILGNKLYVSWCGDSRAYVYNRKAGLHQITKDHSYVQSLVDKGEISKDDAFDYPESNIITRCLCDSFPKVNPESLLSPYEICNGDIIMLCTDGLSGMIRDNEIENTIRNNEYDLEQCSDNLIKAACDAEGADNITICMAQILQGAKECDLSAFKIYDKLISGPQKVINTSDEPDKHIKWKRLFTILTTISIISIAGISYYYYHSIRKKTENATGQTLVQQKKQTMLIKKITDDNGNKLSIECPKGVLEIGSKANPDGTFIRDDTTIIVNNRKVISISIDNKKAPNIITKKDEKISLKKNGNRDVLTPANPKDSSKSMKNIILRQNNDSSQIINKPPLN